jgi:hypothetical protein
MSKVMLLIWLALASTAAWQPPQSDAWMTKNIDQWDKLDVETVLNKSAWVKKQEVRIPFQGQVSAVAGAGTTAEDIDARRTTLGGAHIPVDFEFTLRLRSALPIRMALVRQSQLDANYDKLGKEERAALEPKLKGLLNCPACSENYVITVSSRSKNYPGADAVFSSLQGAKLVDLKRYIFLSTSSGKKRELTHFVPPKSPGDEAVFFFARFNEQGEPLITPDDKEILFRLGDKDNNLATSFRIEVSKIMVNGQVIF